MKKLWLLLLAPFLMGLTPVISDDPAVQKSVINKNIMDIDKRLKKIPSNKFKYPWVDARDYSSISDAVTAIGTEDKVLLISTTLTLSASLTIPNNISLVFYKGGMIAKASTYTLAINGTIEAGNYQIFSGFDDGDITGIRDTNVRWWGAKGNNSNDDTVEIQSAITCAITSTQSAGTVYLPSGIYLTTTVLDIPGYCNFYGDGRSTVIQRTAIGGGYDIIYLHDSSFSQIHDMTIFSTTGQSTNGIHIRNSGYCTIKNITFCGYGANGLFLEGVIGNHFENIRNSFQVVGTSGTPDTPNRGVWLDLDTISGVSSSTTNTFINCSFDLVANEGIRIIEGSVNTFIGCTVQNDGTHPMSYGVYIDSTSCFDNIFINTYFGEGAYGTAQIYDKGNRTTWISPFGETSAAFMWANYGDNKYFTIHPDGNFGMRFFTDTEITRTGADALGLASGDMLDLKTNSNTLRVSPTNGILKSAVTTGEVSVATEGSDYYKPGGTDVALTDGGTGASTAAGARSALGLTGALLGDSTDGRVIRTLSMYMTNATDASKIKIKTDSIWNGDTNGYQDNIAKGGTTGVWTLSANGAYLTLLNTGITGDIVAEVSVVLGYNASGTAITANGYVSGGLYIEFFNSTTGVAVDLTTLIDTGDIQLQITYITSA